jgi:GINS complex subunit 1
MYGDAANKLVGISVCLIVICKTNGKQYQVGNAKRAESLPKIPAYSTELVRVILREIQHLDQSVNATIANYPGTFDPSQDPATATRLLVEHMCMRRDKRCLLAYHRARCNRIEEDIWAGKEVLATGDEEVEGGLSPEEEEYARQYGELLAAYKGKWTDIDLTGSLEPPRELFVDVRVLKDAGEIQTEYGYVTFPAIEE